MQPHPPHPEHLNFPCSGGRDIFPVANILPHRYEIEGDAPGWDEAEKQVKNAAKRGKDGVVVSVKSGKTKRKTGPTAEQIYEEELGDKKRKKVKLGKKAKMS